MEKRKKQPETAGVRNGGDGQAQTCRFGFSDEEDTGERGVGRCCSLSVSEEIFVQWQQVFREVRPDL